MGSVEPADSDVPVPDFDVEPFFQRHVEAFRASQPAATQIVVVVPEFVSANDEMFAIAFSHYILQVGIFHNLDAANRHRSANPNARWLQLPHGGRSGFTR